jgi:hypothetical protein
MKIENKQVEEILTPVVDEVKTALVKYVARQVDMNVWIILGSFMAFLFVWMIALCNWQRVIHKRNKKLEALLKISEATRKTEVSTLENWGNILSKQVTKLSDEVCVYREDKYATNEFLFAGHRREIAGLRKELLTTNNTHEAFADLAEKTTNVAERRLIASQEMVDRLENNNKDSILQMERIKDILANEKTRAAAKASMITAIVNPVEVEDDGKDMNYTMKKTMKKTMKVVDKEVDRERRQMEAAEALIMGSKYKKPRSMQQLNRPMETRSHKY